MFMTYRTDYISYTIELTIHCHYNLLFIVTMKIKNGKSSSIKEYVFPNVRLFDRTIHC